jgi:SET domain-containing protein
MSWQDPPPGCWIHDHVEVHASQIDGRGLFATAPISIGEPVAGLGGTLVTQRELRSRLAAGSRDPSMAYLDAIIWTDDLHLVLPPGEPIHFANHSCDPNLWWVNRVTLVARRPIAAGDELTNDYGTSSGVPEFQMACNCGTALCRGAITGEDWRRDELIERYGNHWAPALLERIRAQRA